MPIGKETDHREAMRIDLFDAQWIYFVQTNNAFELLGVYEIYQDRKPEFAFLISFFLRF